MKRILIAAVLTIGLAGCSMINRPGSRSSPSYRITTNRDIYSRGNTGEATIRNVSSRQLDS